jgi:outer membrane receptor protein involved in Fe transport
MCRRVLPFALLALPAQAHAQEQEVVVTGRGLEAAPGDAAYDISLIDRDRLAHSASNRLEDVLRDVPGFQQFRRSDSRSANPTSQGATLRALGGNASSRALLLLDGVPQSDPFGGWLSWPAYDPRRLGQIRVTRGGGSGVNGPGALAGTIELESAVPGEMDGAAAGLAYGSRDSVDASAAYDARLGSGYASLSAAYARGDGFVPVVARQRGPADRPSPYEQASLAARAVAPVSATIEVQANVSAFSDQRERGTALSAIETRGADASLRLVGRGPLPFAALVYIQTRDFANAFASVNAARTAATQTLDQYNVPSTGTGARVELRPRLGPVALRLGADWRDTEGQTQELFQYVAGSPTRGRIAGGRTDTLGSFAEASLVTGPLTLTGGGRLDHWRITGGALRERTLATGALLTDTAFPDRSGWEPTGRIGLALRAAPFTFRAAAYLGWRLPTLNELYRPFRVGADATAANAALSPERLKGVEAGADFHPAPWARIGVTLFANRLDDAIANVTLGQGPGTFPGVGFVAAGGFYRQRQNVDAVTSRGVEVDASLSFGAFRLAAGYAFADAEVSAAGPATPLDGLRPAQTPRHNLSLSLTWQGPRGLYASAGLHYVSAQFEDDQNAQRIPGALTMDAAVTIPIRHHLALDIRGENLSDEEVIAGISGAGIIERATPRTLWVGLRWTG